jgi:UDP-N-acetylmuramyl tripeptide synthase
MAAERLAPDLLAHLSADLGPTVLVSGTNGKTTTAHLLARILEGTGRRVVANRSGANLRQAITSTLLAEAGLDGRLGPRGATAILEVDEAALGSVADAVSPSVLVTTNLFRDQLDRYGETDEVIRRWRVVLDRLRADAVVVFCADDPRLAHLVGARPGPFADFGLVEPSASARDVSLTPDATTCPRCEGRLAYSWGVVGHLGSFACRVCGFARAAPALEVRLVASHGIDGQVLGFRRRDVPGELTVKVHLPGASSAYNAAAAVTAAISLGVSIDDAVAALASAASPFGRYEEIEIDRRRVVLMLGKNPASLAELIRVAAESAPTAVLFALNDSAADGRDVSWYWDLNPVDLLVGRRYAISGTRSADFRLRLKYLFGRNAEDRAGREEHTSEDPNAALAQLVRAVSPGELIVVIATYTALLGLRAHLVRRGRAPEAPR